MGDRVHRRGRRGGAAALVIAASAIAGACSTTPSFDRDAAVERVVAESAGRIDPDQARCYVDRVIEELGSGVLEPGAQPSPEQVPRLTSIRVDCVGVANLGNFGTTPTGPGVPTTVRPPLDRPQKVGDDPELDQMVASCRAGSGPSCDRLFDLAPTGSEYEEIALTCGGRSSEKRCAEVYPDPNLPTTTATAPPVPTTDAPPAGGSTTS